MSVSIYSLVYAHVYSVCVCVCVCVFVCVCVQENAEHMVSQSLGACPSLLSDKVSRQTGREGGWKRGRGGVIKEH